MANCLPLLHAAIPRAPGNDSSPLDNDARGQKRGSGASSRSSLVEPRSSTSSTSLSSSLSSQSVVKCGWLYKQAQIKRIWQRRWAVLVPGTLHLYYSNRSSRACGAIELDGKVVEGLATKGHKYEWAIRVCNKKVPMSNFDFFNLIVLSMQSPLLVDQFSINTTLLVLLVIILKLRLPSYLPLSQGTCWHKLTGLCS